MSDVELLPCPFCGNPVYARDTEDDSGDYGPYLQFTISCDTPDCFLSNENLYCERNDKDLFISQWNSRYRQRVYKLSQL